MILTKVIHTWFKLFSSFCKKFVTPIIELHCKCKNNISPWHNQIQSSFFFFLVNASCCETLGERFENRLRILFTSWGSFCVRYPSVVILGSLILVVASSGGLVYMRIITNPVDLWSSPESQARQEKDYFDNHFGPFFRTAQLIITTSTNNTFDYNPYFGGSTVPFGAILDKDILHEVCLCCIDSSVDIRVSSVMRIQKDTSPLSLD